VGLFVSRSGRWRPERPNGDLSTRASRSIEANGLEKTFFYNIKFQKSIISIILFIIATDVLHAESFIVEAPKKKMPKITGNDCCTLILDGAKIAARIDQYRGQLTGIQLTWAEDFFDDEATALFKIASKQELQECYQALQELNALHVQYEQGLKKVRAKSSR
jgi:hypothetical protein